MSDAPSRWPGVHEIATGVADGRFGVGDVVEAALARIADEDAKLNAWAVVWPDRARHRARELDALPAERRGPLHGVPVGVKDLCDVAGEPTRAGTIALGDPPATEDATVVRRLEEAGAVVLGRTRMTEGAFTTHHPSAPAPVNPWHAERWTGISSSGSGVAVAAGHCTAALGTDTGGSIRFPSAACGLVGLKPTHGRVSLAGVFPLAPTLDHVGPMARSVDDVARVFAAIAGPDPRDPTTRAASLPSAAIASAGPGLRIGFDRATCSEGVAPEIFERVAAAADVLAASGAEVGAVALPPLGGAAGAWLPICAAEAAEAHASTFPERRADYGPELAGLLDTGRALTGVALARAWRERLALTRRLAAVFSACDVLLCPGLAIRAGADLNLGAAPPPAEGLVAMRFTLPFNLAGWPSLTLPCGRDAEGAPIGLQLVGPPLAEERLLALGAVLEAAGVTAIGHPEALGG